MALTSTTRGIWEIPGQSIDTYWAYGSVNLSMLGSFAAAAWPSANLIIYSPVRIKSRVVARKMWFQSAATGTDNIDIGIYDRGGTRIVSSGAVAKGAVAQEQVVDITDTTIGPGLYYIGFTSTTTTNQFSRSLPTVPNMAAQGARTEAGAGTLPATATWVVDNTLNYFSTTGSFTEPTAT